MRALERMPERQREILLAARLDGVTQKELAARHGISVRMVERELQHAQAYCRARLPYSVGSMIFSRYFKSGAKALDSEAEAWVRHPVRAGHAARRAGVAGMVRTATRTRRRSSGRGAPVDIGQAGRAFRAAHRAAAARWRGPAAGAAARGPGRGRRGSGRRRAAAAGLVGQPGRTGRGLQHGGGRAAHGRLGRRAGRGRTGRPHPHERGRRPAPPELLEGQAAITCRAGPGPDRRGRRRRDPAGRRQREPQRRRGHGHLRGAWISAILRANWRWRPASRRYGAVAVTVPARADMEQAMGWREGVLVFRDMPLSEAVAEINRYRPGRIMVLDDALAARRVSGAFPDRPAGPGDRPDPRGLRRAARPRASCY